MKFIDEIDIELVNQALCFETPDYSVRGGCDLFTTKPVGSDKKLYKTIDKHLDDILQESLNWNMSHSPPTASRITDNVDFQTRFSRRASSSSIVKPTLKRKSFNHHQATTLSKSLENIDINESALYDEETPFGPITSTHSRKIFSYLIGILNASYPDHDFSSLTPDYFTAVDSANSMMNRFNSIVLSLGYKDQIDDGDKDINWIWETINSHMDIQDCSIYALEPKDGVLADLEPNTLWCLMWFIFNKKRKRVAFLHLKATIKNKYSPPMRRNSKVSTLDEVSGNFNLNDEEYDLTYDDDDPNQEDPDVFIEEDDDEDDNNTIVAEDLQVS
ncbi:Regulator of RNA polymerase III [Komagataella phaffii CBS 7435]|uniref:Repressor of RNA polymerase III transcription MAF1 n=2 Tax=Komagataella phaffii TaxID=460519 RepID=C4QV08_KOMPG|nr:Negative regulator of RNA polymerase III [Komagataella phaffii GS115]AOA61218.1 GQ67_02275T0 [Komagataella phaffii]KAI0465485.1 hypothetical protein LJB42_000722 [Komagataella kurtzmanii]CAH2445731.1 Regulator of RNA polymerase III [Komagataella phaffii CBS 7435]AOA66564.1 GQ68_02972T0 [Komagataella phaffii GS115]CAY67078.1 Negative regulator of RNA polymerase III [Komagataella phaffii GS115]